MMSPTSEEVPYGLEFKRETCCQDLMVVAYPWLKTRKDFSKFVIIIIIVIIIIDLLIYY